MPGKDSVRLFPFERIAIFIDGWNLAKASRDWLEKEVNFEKLLEYFSRDAIVLRAFYYIGEQTSEEGRRKQHPFLTWLRTNGYKVVTKPIKTYINKDRRPELKADFDVDIAVDMFALADKIDRAVLFSGDGDFAKLIDRVGMKGVRTQVVSHWAKGIGPTAQELVEAADVFTELADIIDEFVKQ